MVALSASRGLWLGVCAALANGSAAADGNAAEIQKLTRQIAAQEAKIKALETAARAKGTGKGACAVSAVDLAALDAEPELRSFRAAERQRAAAKRQEQLVTVFNVSVRTSLHLCLVTNTDGSCGALAGGCAPYGARSIERDTRSQAGPAPCGRRRYQRHALLVRPRG